MTRSLYLKLQSWKMSKISIDEYFSKHLKPTLSYKDDIYFNKDYARLYGEVFEFEFCKKGFEFKTIGIKERIENSEFFDLQSPYGYSGFFCNSCDESFIKEALNALHQKAQSEKIIAFFLRFHPFDEALSLYEKYLNFYSVNKKVIIVSTKSTLQEIRSNYSPRIKSYVNKARKELDLLVVDKENKEDLSEFKSLYDETMRRNEAESFYFFTQDYFNNFAKFKESLIIKASFKGKNLAFASFFLGKDFAYYHLSANTNEKNANLACLDYFFELCSAKGISFALLGGGVKDDDNLFYYKQRFSTLYTHFHIGGLVFDEKEFTKLTQNTPSKKFLAYRYDKWGGGYIIFLSADILTKILINLIKDKE